MLVMLIIIRIFLRVFSLFSFVSFILGKEIYLKIAFYILKPVSIFLLCFSLSYSVAKSLVEILFYNYAGDVTLITLCFAIPPLIVSLFFAGGYYLECTRFFFEAHGEGIYKTNFWHNGMWKVMILHNVMCVVCINGISLLMRAGNAFINLIFNAYEVSLTVLIASFALKWLVLLPLIVYAAYKIFDTVFYEKTLLM